MELFDKLRLLFNTVVRWFRPNGHHVAEPAHPPGHLGTVGVDQATQGGDASDRYSTREAKPPPPTEELAPPRSGVHTREEEKRDTAPPNLTIKPRTGETTPPDYQPMNRAMRRKMNALERERRKLDRFVKPQGPEPIHITRGPRPFDPNKATKPTRFDPPPEAEIPIADNIEGHYVEIKESEIYGEFNFRDSILDQLDRYWVYLDRMKKHDPDAYGFYKQVGAHIVPHVTSGTHEDDHRSGIPHIYTPEEIEKYKADTYISAWFNANRPAFGCVAWGAHSVAEKIEMQAVNLGNKKEALWIPKFLYMTKYKRPPPTVQPTSGGDVYGVTVWWDRPQDAKAKLKWGAPTQFAVFVSADGKQIEALRTCSTKLVELRHTKAHGYRGSLRGRTFTIPQREWRIPDAYDRWAAQYGLTPQLHLSHLFCTVTRIIELSNYSMARIEVHKDDLTAVFGVNIKRMSYFFQDRDYVLTDSGTRKRIFHCVRPFVRRDGKAVKMHFRGMREFTWAGYKVNITVPGLDHFMLPEVNIGVEDEYWHDKNEKYLSDAEFGKFLVEQMKAGHGGGR